MPKSKVRKHNNKQKVQRQTHPVHYGQHHSSHPGDYIVKAGTLRAGNQTLTLPTPLIIRAPIRGEISEAWMLSGKATMVGIGGSNPFLTTLSDEARDILTHCSVSDGMSQAYGELFAWGHLPVEQLDTPSLRRWLDENYLGTWDDPTLAVGAFLRDMDRAAQMPSQKRRIAYERLAQMAEITEVPLGNGRTIVFLDRDFDDMRRFLANQYMIHGHMPEVIGLG